MLIVLSNFFFGTGENVVAAFLPELAKGEALGKVSAWGWTLGYIGGLLTLARVPRLRDLGAGARASSAQQLRAGDHADHRGDLRGSPACRRFLILSERALPQRNAAAAPTSRAFARVGQTLRHARRYRDLARFLVCIVLYQAGVQTVIALAAIYAQQAMHFTTRDTLLLILVVNVTASLGALLFGQVQDRLGHRPHHCAHPGRLVRDGADGLGEHARPPGSGWPPTSPACAWAPASPPGARWSAT